MEPKWLTIEMVSPIHAQTIRHFDGPPGVRDPSLLESALEHRCNLYHYADAPSLFDLAAAYCAEIIKWPALNLATTTPE